MRILRIWQLLLAAIALGASLSAQDMGTSVAETARITGTVSDVSGDILSGATIVLEGNQLRVPLKVLSDDNGSFAFSGLAPGTYHVTITAREFAEWKSPDILLSPGQYLILMDGKLRIAKAITTVSVAESPEEIATEQVKVEETQRIFGVIPNFYVVYDQNPAPLTTRLKFQLALRTSVDLVTFLGIGVLAGMDQAGNTPDYRQGWKGYAERFGAVTADGFSDTMIGGAILPSLLHQDPRYYYQGIGTSKSRTLHALASPFVCRGDSGGLQFNYSSIGGDLGSAALSNLYYPPSNRSATLVFENLALSTGERMVSSLVQEFVLHKLTPKAKK